MPVELTVWAIDDNDPPSFNAFVRDVSSVAEEPVSGGAGQSMPITISVGVAASTNPEPDRLIEAADGNLYAAKTAGRNCIFGG